VRARARAARALNGPRCDTAPRRIAGTAHNINMPPAAFTGRVDGFVSFDTLEWLGQTRDYTSLDP
jgi:hypothetical protein